MLEVDQLISLVSVPSEEALALLRLNCRMKGLPAELADEPALVPRVLAEGGKTARGQRCQAEAFRVLDRHLAQLKAGATSSPWREGPPVIDMRADYGLLPALSELRGRPTEG